jgi:hypothetical protein
MLARGKGVLIVVLKTTFISVKRVLQLTQNKALPTIAPFIAQI